MSTRIPAPKTAMRKAPRQARSRATVEAITVAGARVLGERGWAGFTTNEVAVVAGVSIGSLYQYFPNKLSLIDAIRRRHFDDVLAVVRSADAGPASLPQRAGELVRGMVAAHDMHPALHRVLLEEVPNDDASKAAHHTFEAEYLERYRAFIATHMGRAGASGEIAARVLSAAIEGVIHDAACRGTLTSPELERELVDLICAYLQGAGSRDDGRPRR
ncbi:TetR/AcrR family transcriptional regulator [Burkholderia alba]|uniref:TetR/AcrR family transcriptional regulator n=1 Tax=Burkholderia alba TaxID=2683677 RepID=UPI002B062351|nr:TetR/AcrR family transcriptional regulator [Burkholderia alba]